MTFVHFDPTKSIEVYIQECGRAGCEGLSSTVTLLYNGLLSVYCDKNVKTFFYVVLSHFIFGVCINH